MLNRKITPAWYRIQMDNNRRWYKEILWKNEARMENRNESIFIMCLLTGCVLIMLVLANIQLDRTAKAQAFEDCRAKHIPVAICKMNE